MKKIQLLKQLSMLVLILLLLSSCSSPKPETLPKKKIAEPERQDLLIIGGGTGGAWAAISNGMAEIIRQNIPGYSANATTGGGVANVTRVAKGEADLALSNLSNLLDAQQGKVPYEEKLGNVRSVIALYDSAPQFMVRASTGLSSIKDIKKQKYPLKLSVHLKGSNVEQTNQRLLEAHGITYADIENWGGKVYFTDSQESANLFRDGHIDAYSYQSIVPLSLFVELAATNDVTFLSASNAAIEKLHKDYGFARKVIPAGTYKGQNQAVNTVASLSVLMTREEVLEEVIYNITQAIAENINFLAGSQSALKDLPLEYMAGDGLEGTLHAGAEKYFKEVGALE